LVNNWYPFTSKAHFPQDSNSKSQLTCTLIRITYFLPPYLHLSHSVIFGSATTLVCPSWAGLPNAPIILDKHMINDFRDIKCIQFAPPDLVKKHSIFLIKICWMLPNFIFFDISLLPNFIGMRLLWCFQVKWLMDLPPYLLVNWYLSHIFSVLSREIFHMLLIYYIHLASFFFFHTSLCWGREVALTVYRFSLRNNWVTIFFVLEIKLSLLDGFLHTWYYLINLRSMIKQSNLLHFFTYFIQMYLIFI